MKILQKENKMKNLNLIIGTKLKDIRNKRNLSLDNVAKLTNVSKAMLGQIERGQSNPTVSTLWKISTGLKVSFSSFIDEENEGHKIVYQGNITPLMEDNNRMKLYPIFPFDSKRNLEIFTIELEPGCNHVSTPHNDDVEEYVIVTEGKLELVIDGKSFVLQKGNSIRFTGNKLHSYKNLNSKRAVFQNVITY